MAKRTNAQIEKDYKTWRNLLLEDSSITSWNELASKANVSVAEVRTSFSKHPVVYSRFQKLFDERKASSTTKRTRKTPKTVSETKSHTPITTKLTGSQDVIICDVPVLIDCINHLLEYPKVVVPSSVFGKIYGMAKNHTNPCHTEARRALTCIDSNHEKFIVMKNDAEISLLTHPDESAEIRSKNSYWLTEAVVASACYQWANSGNSISIVTRTADIQKLAALQGIDIKIIFPSKDNETKGKTASAPYLRAIG